MLEVIWDFIIMVLGKIIGILLIISLFGYFIWGFLAFWDDKYDKMWK